MKKLIAITALSCLLLTGCGGKNNETTEPNNGSNSPSASAPTTASPTMPSTSAPTTETTAPSCPLPQDVFFDIYYPNEDFTEFLHKAISLDALSAQAVLDQLIALGVVSSDVTVNDASLDETQLNLDLHSNFLTQLHTLGSTGERFVVGSIVNTFLSAYGAESVMITVDGDLMDSGHMVYDSPLTFIQ